MNMKNRFSLALATLIGTLAVTSAAISAPASPYDDMVAAVDWSDVISAITTVATAVVGVLIVLRGVRFVMQIVRR